ncbi:hypothetical protein C0989_011324 [Termitomyces sp. Mn162]|nr:hypothetical protein C0989_011324 [Termitomyces sp. Mn162]KAH0579437.1 hypothetical protein H2248_002299 [Termitomyces sp. 'cryptogamus']
MSSLLINIHVTKAGLDLKFDKDDVLEYKHRVSKPSVGSITESNSSTFPQYYNSCWDGSSYPFDESIVSEESISSAQSNAAIEFSISLARQDPIGTPRRPDASYSEGLNRIPAVLSQAPGYERGSVSVTESKPKGHQRPRYESANASHTSQNMKGLHHLRMYAADLVKDEDEYLPRRPATSRAAIAPLLTHKETNTLPRLYAHNPRFRSHADDAMRRMRTENVQKKFTPAAAQNPHSSRNYPSPVGAPYSIQSTRQSLRTQENSSKLERTTDGFARPNDAVQRMCTETLDKEITPTAAQNPHSYSFRKHPFPISGPNPFRPTRQTLLKQEKLFKHVIDSVDRLIEDDDEEIIVYLDSHLAAKEIAVAVAEEERTLQEVRPPKHRSAVLNQRAHNFFLAQRRLLSPPQTHRCPDETEAESFDDFPVCEMSIAMGLHDSNPRSD